MSLLRFSRVDITGESFQFVILVVSAGLLDKKKSGILSQVKSFFYLIFDYIAVAT